MLSRRLHSTHVSEYMIKIQNMSVILHSIKNRLINLQKFPAYHHYPPVVEKSISFFKLKQLKIYILSLRCNSLAILQELFKILIMFSISFFFFINSVFFFFHYRYVLHFNCKKMCIGWLSIIIRIKIKSDFLLTSIFKIIFRLIK